MITEELREYVNKQRAKNITDDVLRRVLTDNGWKLDDIDAALSDDDVVPQPPTEKIPTPSGQSTQPQKQVSHTLWDAFEHILMFISLYVLAIAIALFLHYLVNRFAPVVNNDIGTTVRSYWQLSMVRGYMAAMIVSFPLFAFFFLRITRRTKDMPSIRELLARKILIYLTLIGTFLIMLANVIQTVFNFLEGNFSVNFILHLIVTMTVSGIIFAYYLAQVKEDRKG